jgi:hypothetical protein
MRVEEYGVVFETGRPVTFRFVRSTEKAPYFGSRFQQDIEPAGVYLVHNPTPGDLPPRWVAGTATFEYPMVVLFNAADRFGGYDEDSWKAHLHDEYGKTGRALSTAVLKDGYDAIVTVGDGYTKEIVALRPGEQLAFDVPEPQENPQPKDYSFFVSCIGADGDEINRMKAGARAVTYETMLAHCRGMLDYAVSIGYERRTTSGHGLTLKNDWHVGYYKGRYGGCPVYFFVWSGIEHIWVKDGCEPRVRSF